MSAPRVDGGHRGVAGRLGRPLVGDEVVAINGREPMDVIEYTSSRRRRRAASPVRRAGEESRATCTSARRPESARDRGLLSVFDRIRTCDNHCAFCFIYNCQGMRKSST